MAAERNADADAPLLRPVGAEPPVFTGIVLGWPPGVDHQSEKGATANPPWDVRGRASPPGSPA